MGGVVGVGIDIVRVDRFVRWGAYSVRSVNRVFTTTEIAECRGAAASLASRFAVKEAAFKAISMALAWYGEKPLKHFVSVARFLEVVKNAHGIPQLKVNWRGLASYVPMQFGDKVEILTSLSHESCHAVAIVIVKERTPATTTVVLG